MPQSMRPGDEVAGRYRLIDLLSEARGGRFWRAWDTVLSRAVALHLIASDDSRAETLHAAARASARLHDPRLLRVLDAGTVDNWCYVVNEWGEGDSLDIMLTAEPLSPRRAAWVVGELAELLDNAHRHDITHGRLLPDNVLIDERGSVKVIGFAVDAALHGITPATPQQEFLDLIGILYAALTARWPRPGLSKLPAAPRDHGTVLRPRQVRAGVPRVLDTLCDGVLNPGRGAAIHAAPHTPAEVATELFDFVGDRQAMAEAEVERQRGDTSPRIPVVNALVWAPSPAPDSSGDSSRAGGSTSGTGGPGEDTGEDTGEQTQLGLPSFDDEVLEADWRTPSDEPPPPPPPFEESPERPLFAPEPPDGHPQRVPRNDIALPEPVEFWPWETDPSQVPVVEDPEPEEPVPGRGWFRIALLLALALIVLVASVYAFNRGRDTVSEEAPAASQEDTTASSMRVQVDPAAVFDFDPEGDPPSEKPEMVPLAFDGDLETAWETQSYRDQFGPQGLKSGVGLLIDLGTERQIREVHLTIPGGATGVQLLASPASDRPSSADDLEVVAEGTSSEEPLVMVPDTTHPQRWLVVWLTSLPGDGDFRGRIAEVVVYR